MIVTFYSFKGGTGRTMALANIAVMLAKAKKRVLAVDFDLEAPGLWRFFQDFRADLDDHPGLLDMLIAQSQEPDDRFIDWRDYVTSVDFESGSISLMTSGTIDVGYPARVLEFTWTGLYRQVNGGAFIEHLRSQWLEEYDFVLIDSRTGITDTGGVCTIALPDLIVPVVVANAQSIEGTLEVLRRAQRARREFAYDRPPALVLPILSRFDMRTEYEMAEQWLDLLSDRFRTYYADWLPSKIPPRTILEKTKLPYVPYFSFGEKLAALREGTSDPESLGYALNSVSGLIETELRSAAELASGISYRPERARVPADTEPNPAGELIARPPDQSAERRQSRSELPSYGEPEISLPAATPSASPDLEPAVAPSQHHGKVRQLLRTPDRRPYFFLSYARTPRRDPDQKSDPDRWVHKLYRDMSDVILQLTDALPDEAGFIGQGDEIGPNWSADFVEALATCRVFVPLYSRRYFESDSCGKEWFWFSRRELVGGATAGEETGAEAVEAIVPALWTRLNLDTVPSVARALQFDFSALSDRYAVEGFYGIMKLQNYRADYQRAVHRICERIIDVAYRTTSRNDRIAEIELENLQMLPSAFGPGSVSSLMPGLQLSVVVLAHDRSSLPPNYDSSYYGATPEDWAPYRPDFAEPLIHYTRKLIKDCLGVGSVLTTADAMRAWQSAGGPNSPTIALVDPLLATSQDGRELLSVLDAIQESWVSILIPWNERNVQIAHSGMAIRESLTGALGRKLAGVPRSCEVAATGAPTLQVFSGVLPQLATIMTKRFLREVPAYPPTTLGARRVRLESYDL
jgi:FxsC-like protein